MTVTALDKRSPTPLYHQLKAVLLSAIQSGRWKAGEQLPTESELAEMYGVSKITVREALRELAQMRYVRREQGRGTFVARTHLEQGPRELTSFSEEMRRRGYRSSSRVLARDVIAAAYLPLRLVPGVEKRNLESRSLYEILRKDYNLVPERAKETHSAIALDAETASLLGIPRRSPAMAVERVTFLASGQPLELVDSVMRGDQYQIVLDLVSEGRL